MRKSWQPREGPVATQRVHDFACGYEVVCGKCQGHSCQHCELLLRVPALRITTKGGRRFPQTDVASILISMVSLGECCSCTRKSSGRVARQKAWWDICMRGKVHTAQAVGDDMSPVLAGSPLVAINLHRMRMSTCRGIYRRACGLQDGGASPS
jgi:hypothetical protein